LTIILLFSSVSYSKGAETMKSNVIPNSFNKIVFQPWGPGNNLILEASLTNKTGTDLSLQGKTTQFPIGFVSQDFDYRGSHISVIIGNVSKFPVDSKISLGFDVKGLFRNYSMIFVLGKSHWNGWNGDIYYHELNAHTSYDIDLADIIAAHNGLYLETNRVILTVDRKTSIMGIDFGIQFNQSKVE
jgi:hypothetical protein